MKLIIKLARTIKSWFLRFKLHRVFGALTGPFATTAWLTRLSQWVDQTERPVFNDFYVPDRDYNRRYGLYDHLLKTHIEPSFNYLEFGVAAGLSFNWWRTHATTGTCRFFGFDTFTGLPENWTVFKAGDMSADGAVPDVDGDTRACFYKGVFQDTLPAFLTTFPDTQQKVIHLDADIYSATLFVLTQLGTRLRLGDVLIFDEFNVPMHEFRAFQDFIGAYYIDLKLVGAVNNYYQVAFVVAGTRYAHPDS